LVLIVVTPANPSILVGNAQQLIATGTFSDTSTRQLASLGPSTTVGVLVEKVVVL
jgi:hypothetical protein